MGPRLCSRISATAVTTLLGIVGFLATSVGMSGIIGCSSGSSSKAGAISVVAANGGAANLTSLAVNAQAKVSMTPAGDPADDGVDWTVTCGGSPITGSITGGACGTLTPGHTSDGIASTYTAPANVPLGSTVTISASVTSNPSANSTVTLTINPVAIAIEFLSLPPTTLSVGATTPVSAQLTNDTADAGAKWTVTCGSSDCGKFSLTTTASAAETTYAAPSTVPSGNTVTITATSVTDSTKSIAGTVTILPVVAVGVSVTPASTYATTGGAYESTQLIANVINDANNAGVTWSVSCGSSATGACGSISAQTASGGAATFVGPRAVPSGGTVSIKATSVTDPTKSGTAVANIITTTPVVVTQTQAPPATIAGGQTATLAATVANDSNNLGVNWTVSCGSASCGSFSPAHTVSGGTTTYTAPTAVPNGGVVVISAASPATTPAVAAVSSTTVTAAVTVANITIAFLQPLPASVVANSQTPVSAVVSNDAANGGVTWSVQCTSTIAGACGYILPTQTASGDSATYTAPPTPPSGAVSVVATSTTSLAAATSSSTSSAVSVTAPITVTASTALSIRFLPGAPSQLQAGNTVSLNAAVTNDSSRQGVDWQVCASGCGFFTTTPAIAAIAATAVAPFQPAVPAVTATTVSGWPNGLPIPYTAPSSPNGALSISAAAHANSSTAVAASIAIVDSGQGPALHGIVKAGTAPVVGSAVSLYAAGTSGYGSASTLLYSPSSSPAAVTDSNGNFIFSGGYTCPQSSSEVYLVASGGKVGANGNNPNLTMMTALGPCGALSSSSVMVNEVTTVASAWALANFEANDPLTGNSSYLNVGTSSGNAAGLANAFAAVNNLVDITAGAALFTVPAGNAAVPYAEINTLADVLNTCTSTGGGVEGDGSACGNLFSHTDPLTGGPILNPTSPADTLQAAINIAQHPDGQFGYAITAPAIFSLLGTSQPFQPVLNAQPNDFSMSLNYTAGGGLSSSSSANFFALDGSGNLWITDTTHNRMIEWNNEGTPVSISGFTNSSLLAPGPVAVDTAGHVWTCDNDGLTELTALGTEAPGSPFVGGGITSGCEGMAFDGLGNLWVSNSASVSEFDSLGVAVSPAVGFTIPVSPTDTTAAALQPPIAIDDSNNVWVGVTNPANPGGQYLAQLNDNGAPSLLNPVTVGATPASYFVAASSIGGQTQIAINHGGDVWLPVGGTNTAGLNEVLPYAGVGTTDLVTQVFSGSSNSTDNPFTQPNGVAIDGAGMVWVPSIGNAQVHAGLTEIDPSDGSAFADFAAPSLASPPLNAAVDGSGNVWVLLSGNTLTEYIGLASPAVTPLSAAVKGKKLGSLP